MIFTPPRISTRADFETWLAFAPDETRRLEAAELMCAEEIDVAARAGDWQKAAEIICERASELTDEEAADFLRFWDRTS